MQRRWWNEERKWYVNRTLQREVTATARTTSRRRQNGQAACIHIKLLGRRHESQGLLQYPLRHVACRKARPGSATITTTRALRLLRLIRVWPHARGLGDQHACNDACMACDIVDVDVEIPISDDGAPYLVHHGHKTGERAAVGGPPLAVCGHHDRWAPHGAWSAENGWRISCSVDVTYALNSGSDLTDAERVVLKREVDRHQRLRLEVSPWRPPRLPC